MWRSRWCFGWQHQQIYKRFIGGKRVGLMKTSMKQAATRINLGSFLNVANPTKGLNLFKYFLQRKDLSEVAMKDIEAWTHIELREKGTTYIEAR